MKYVIPVFVFAFLAAPILTGAQEAGLVTCDGPDCDWEDLIGLINNVVKWLVAFLAIVAVIVMVYAGFKLVVSAGNTTEAEEAKKMFTNVVIGFIIVLAAWVIVDTLLSTLTTCGGLDRWINPGECGS